MRGRILGAKSEPVLTNEEMKRGIILLWCKKCNRTTKHKRILKTVSYQNCALDLVITRTMRTNYVECLECGNREYFPASICHHKRRSEAGSGRKRC